MCIKSIYGIVCTSICWLWCTDTEICVFSYNANSIGLVSLKSVSSLPDTYNKTSNVKHVPFMLQQKLHSSYKMLHPYILTLFIFFGFFFLLILNKIWFIHVPHAYVFIGILTSKLSINE